jgi:DNA-binding CsgD family transcriptional regulator
VSSPAVILRRVPASGPERLCEDNDIDVLRQLLGRVSVRASQLAPIDAAAAGPAEVLLDVQVDGFRYILTRTLLAPPLPAAALSPREREIVRLIARGLPNKAIAAALDISLWTVATHIRRVFTARRQFTCRDGRPMC